LKSKTYGRTSLVHWDEDKRNSKGERNLKTEEQEENVLDQYP